MTTAFNWAARIGLFACVPVALAACVIEDEPPRRLSSGGSTATPAPTATTPTASPTAPSGSASSSTPTPMLVEVDTGQVMTADPGQGVGVFVEYAAGGQWHVWWTCDTARTQKDCDFNVSLSTSGKISDIDATKLTGGYTASPSDSRVEARIVTSTEVNGLSFATQPGATITLEASVGGIQDGSFLFFVQDGKVNGGYPGKLTNPLQLVGKTP